MVGKRCKDVAASIDVLELPDLPEKGDVSDWIAAGGTADQLRALPTRPFAEWLAAQPVHVETDDERLARLAALSRSNMTGAERPKRMLQVFNRASWTPP